MTPKRNKIINRVFAVVMAFVLTFIVTIFAAAVYKQLRYEEEIKQEYNIDSLRHIHNGLQQRGGQVYIINNMLVNRVS